MVGQGEGLRQRKAERGKAVKKTLRAGNGGDGNAAGIGFQTARMQRFIGMGVAIGRGGADLAGEQGNGFGQPEMLLRGGGNGGRGLAEHDGIHVAQSGDGFAQAAVGQHV